jgi:hypothetical protein
MYPRWTESTGEIRSRPGGLALLAEVSMPEAVESPELIDALLTPDL